MFPSARETIKAGEARLFDGEETVQANYLAARDALKAELAHRSSLKVQEKSGILRIEVCSQHLNPKKPFLSWLPSRMRRHITVFIWWHWAWLASSCFSPSTMSGNSEEGDWLSSGAHRCRYLQVILLSNGWEVRKPQSDEFQPFTSLQGGPQLLRLPAWLPREWLLPV